MKLCVVGCPDGATFGSIGDNTQVKSTSTTDPEQNGGGVPPSDCGNYGAASYALLLSNTICECPTGWGGSDCTLGN